MDSEEMMRAARVMNEAATNMQRAANTMDRIWGEIRPHVDPDCGGAMTQLLEEMRRIREGVVPK